MLMSSKVHVKASSIIKAHTDCVSRSVNALASAPDITGMNTLTWYPSSVEHSRAYAPNLCMLRILLVSPTFTQ